MANVLSIQEIAQVAVNAGMKSGSNALYTCVAICLAESGGDFDANNEGLNPDGTVDYGGWQINTVHNPPLPDIYKPSVNAQYMMNVSNNGTNWQPWVTYWKGSYLTHMGKVTGELSGVKFTPGPGSDFDTAAGGNGATFQQANMVTDVLGAGDGIVDFFKALANPKTWVRVIKVVIGIALVLLAISNVIMGSKAAKQAVDVGMMVATKGKSSAVKAGATKGAVAK